MGNNASSGPPLEEVFFFYQTGTFGPPFAYLYTGEGVLLEGGIRDYSYWERDRAAYYEERARVRTAKIRGTEIPVRALMDCDRLVSLLLHEGLLKIGSHALSCCSSLRRFRCPSTVTEIGFGAFWGCSRLVEVVLPEGLVSIEVGTFCGCTSLREIRIPATVARIGFGAFSGCRNLRLLDLCEGLRWIERRAFNGCWSLRSLLLPSSVEDVGGRAFMNCRNLLSVQLHEDLPVMRRSSFAGCTSLESFRFVRLSERKDAISMDDRTTAMFEDRLWEITLAMTEADQEAENLWNARFEEWRITLATEAGQESENLWEKCKKSLGRGHDVLTYLELKEATSTLELAFWKARIEGQGEAARGFFAQFLLRLPWARERKRRKVTMDIAQDPQARQDCRVNCGAKVVIENVLEFFDYSSSWPGLDDDA